MIQTNLHKIFVEKEILEYYLVLTVKTWVFLEYKTSVLQVFMYDQDLQHPP